MGNRQPVFFAKASSTDEPGEVRGWQRDVRFEAGERGRGTGAYVDYDDPSPRRLIPIASAGQALDFF